MNRAWLLFLTPLALFAAWLCYLGWMVKGRPIQAPGYALVVSRPQILASAIDAIVELPDRSGKGKVLEVLYPAEGSGLKKGDAVEVEGIDECRPLAFARATAPPDDWTEPGAYLVPLRRVKGKYEVSPIPPSPGFPPPGSSQRVMGSPVMRIYRDSAEVRAQYERIAKP